MVSVPCPRCGKPVGLEEEICPHCRTPRDDMEMEEGRALVRKEELRIKRRPKIIAACVAVAILLAVAWSLRGFAIVRIRAGWKQFALEVERTRDPVNHFKPGPPDEPVKPEPPPAAKAEIAVIQMVPAISTKTAAPAAAPAAIKVAAREAPAAAAPVPDAELAPAPQPMEEQRIIYGVVYYAATKKPASTALIQFKSSGRATYLPTTTDSAGRYLFFLPDNRLPGEMTVTVNFPGGRKYRLLADQNPSYLERSPEARATLIAETVSGDPQPVTVQYRENDRLIEFNLMLLPKKKNIK